MAVGIDLKSTLRQLNLGSYLQTKGASIPSFPAFITNLKASNTAKFRAVVKAGTRNAIIHALGDSTTAGQSAGMSVTAGNVNTAYGQSRYNLSWPNRLVPKLIAAGRPAGANGFMGFKNGYGGGTIGSFIESDARHSVAGGWTIQGVESAGGLVFGGTAAGAFDTFTPQEPVTDFIIYATGNGGHSPFGYSVDGGTVTQASTASGGLTITRVPITGLTRGTHSVKIEWVSGTTRIMGVDAWDSTRREIMIRNLGISGIRSGGTPTEAVRTAGGLLFDSGNSRPYERRNAQVVLAPDLTLLEAGVANDILQAYGVAWSKENIRLLIQDAKTTGDVILCPVNWLAGTTGDTANQQAYIDAMYALSVEEDVPVFDIRKVTGWTSYNEANTAGFMSDFAHPTALGYDRIADNYVTGLNLSLNF